MKKIAIMTQPLGHNYGGILQNYALKKVLEQSGNSVTTINRRPKSQPRILRGYLSIIKNQTFNRLTGAYYYKPKQSDLDFIYADNKCFLNKYIDLSVEIDNTKDLKKYFGKRDFDAVIVGSDQTWRPKYSPSITNYFLDFLADNKSIKKIAYACSFGTNSWEFNEQQHKACKQLIATFNSISVRESAGIDLCREYLNTEAQLVLDPTLLLKKEDYLELVKNKFGDTPPLKEGLFNYILDDSKEKKQLVDCISEHLSLSSFRTQPIKTLPIKDKNNLIEYKYPSIEEWLNSFNTADYIITDSFHGTVLSLLFEKPFITIVNKKRGSSRFESLLSLLGLEHRMFYDIGDVSKAVLEENIDYDAIKFKLEPLKKLSMNFIESSLLLSNNG